MDFPALLKVLATQDGSDLYLSTGAPPCAKFNGVLKPLGTEAFKPGDVAVIANGIMDAEQRVDFERELEMNLAFSLSGVGRFRINIFKQRNEVSIVARNIKLDIPKFEDLHLPPILLDVIMEKHGLVLFVGATGSGKSTSLAALIDHRNRHASGHIITIEDPVEFIHKHKRSIINQREVGVDTRSFHAALKNTLRQAPDVILIGEIRDRETMEHALAFADTGTWRSRHCTPTTPTRRWTASSISSPKSAARSCCMIWATTSRRSSPSGWSRPPTASAARPWR
jgi:twitching motility protein PilU